MVEHLFVSKMMTGGRLTLSSVIRRLGKRPSTSEVLEVAGKRERLQARIDAYQKQAAQFWQPDAEEFRLQGPEIIRDPIGDESDASDDADEDYQDVFAASPFDDHLPAEIQPLLLPSNLGMALCDQHGYSAFVKQEKTLRTGQANDALQGIRLGLSKKATIFRVGLRTAKTKTKKLRSWDQIVSVDINVRHHASVYSRARSALLELGASQEELDRYPVLLKEHLKVTTARIDPSMRGQRDSSLAWFWTMDVQNDMDQVDGMAECRWLIPLFPNLMIQPFDSVYRVHWLKAKARRDRWAEERTVLANEMDWIVAFFKTQEALWTNRIVRNSSHSMLNGSGDAMPEESSQRRPITQGHQCYALRQQKMWLIFADWAANEFSEVKMGN
jgi:hypothetical protein